MDKNGVNVIQAKLANFERMTWGDIAGCEETKSQCFDGIDAE
jgi:hypothetical protein